MKSFNARVKYARECFYSRDTKKRAFDDCFENSDGDAVVTALVRMCETDDILKHRIATDWRGVFPQSWLDTAKKYESTDTNDLAKLAKKLRDEEKIKFEAQLRERIKRQKELV
jgi:hypothetical protein